MFLRDTCQCDIHRRNNRDKRFTREACFDQGDVKVERDSVAFNEEKHEDILLEEGPQIERVTVLLMDTCHCEIFQRNKSDKRFPRGICFDQGDVKVEKHNVTLNTKKDEDILVEEGTQIERVTVFLRDTCHCEICHRNIHDTRPPCKVCFDQGDFKVEKGIQTFNDEEDEDTPVEEVHGVSVGTCRCEICQRNIRDKRTLVVVILFFLCKPYVTITQ